MGTGLKLGMAAYERYFGSFGYTSKTGIDLPGEAGSIFNLQSELDLVIYAFGQNFNVTPIQQICAIAAVANGGNLMTPYLVSSIKDNNGNVIYNREPETKRQVVSEDICKTVSEILEDGVSGDGGARNAYVAGYRVAAKTGTSEKKDSSNIPIDVERYVVSTAGYAPADDPKLAILILVDEPTNPPLYGSIIAAPYVGKLFEQILPNVEGVEAQYSQEEIASLSITTPDYSSAKWWSPETAKSYAEKLGFKVEVVGSGSVVTGQVPAAGSMVLKSNAKLILYTGNEEPTNTVVVPNITGKTAAAANQTLINSGLNIKIEGSKYYHEGGTTAVESQSPAAGTVVPAGTVVVVNFGYYEDNDLGWLN
jgi:stage V sporulation protein D (sporulation-specific penicillin-binding protein)